MPSSNPRGDRGLWSCGRGFESIDPERQREVVGFVRSGPINTVPAQRARGTPPSRFDWMRMQPERDSPTYEGSSSRRGR